MEKTGLTTQKDIEKMQEELANVIEGKISYQRKNMTKVLKTSSLF
jgi:CRISPR/Cas system type I-B associated protein Csh2 (Cas7 group RAMP superfamily)